MVMHARKTQRMNDGYFEKHQSHPYQNSKYNSRFERIRDSPNGTYRSDSPDSQSPRDRDRVYQSKSSYSIQKVREKERENRDYKSSRDKYSDCSRSPKDKRARDAEYRTNHDRSDDKSVKSSQNVSTRDRKSVHNSCTEKRDERDRITRVGDWSEHTSSSGKKYYYNCKTEVSQWEKPREWVDRERERDRDRFRSRDRDREYSSSSSRSGHDKHSNSRTSVSSNKDSGAAGSNRHWNRDENERSSHKYSDDNSLTMQDMDISPGDSTPTSESQQLVGVENSVGPVLLATALPRLVSHPNVLTTTTTRIEISPQATPIMVPPPLSVATSNAPGPPAVVNLTLSRSLSQIPNTPDINDKTLVMSRQSSSSEGGNSVHLTVDSNHNGPMGEGPPTPTHSETPDSIKVSAPLESPQSTSLPPIQSVPSTLQNVSSSLQALRPQGPSITPSLANYYNDDLLNHVRGWPAEILEKQAEKLAQEANILCSLQCARVSAELKSTRSVVRLTEIQATLQEQRILFLRQQIRALEEMKSQNSFMSDDS